MSVHSSAGGGYSARLSEELRTLMVQEKKLGVQLWRRFRILTSLALICNILAWTMGYQLLALAMYGLFQVPAFVCWLLFTIHREMGIVRSAASKLLTFEEVAELNKAESDRFASLLDSFDEAFNRIGQASRMLPWCPKHQELVRRTLIACCNVLKVLDRDPKFSMRIRAYPLLIKLVENK